MAGMIQGAAVIVLGMTASGAALAGPQYDSRGYGSSYASTVRCESDGGRQQRCPTAGARDVRLVRQLSSSDCVQGRTWGVAADYVWVSGGCRADFTLRSRGGAWNSGYPGGGYPGNSGSGTFRCESRDRRYQECGGSGSGRGRAVLVRQTSDTRCEEGRNWGTTRNGGVWVDDGCSGEFSMSSRGGRWNSGGNYGYGQSRTIRCESGDRRTQTCSADIRSGVQLVRQLSDTRCVQGRNWGWDGRGIWVSDGCRAEFSVR